MAGSVKPVLQVLVLYNGGCRGDPHVAKHFDKGMIYIFSGVTRAEPLDTKRAGKQYGKYILIYEQDNVYFL